MWSELPYLGTRPDCFARLKSRPEDFEVEELLGFQPDGDGEHYLLKIRKRNRNTMDVAREIAHRLGVRLLDVGYAGLKDRRAVTSQWFSVPAKAFENSPPLTSVDGWEVLDHERHRRKLRRGSHLGNRFTIQLSDFRGSPGKLACKVSELRRTGFPNYFGEQRFGVNYSNVERARLELGRARGSFRSTADKMMLSAARSWLFNAVLGHRLRDHTWIEVLAGEILVLSGSRSHFVAEDGDLSLAARVKAFDVHTSGPLWGQGAALMGRAWSRERGWLGNEPELLDALEISTVVPARRALRATVDDVSLDWPAVDSPRLSFTLGRGSYATAVIRGLAVPQ